MKNKILIVALMLAPASLFAGTAAEQLKVYDDGQWAAPSAPAAAPAPAPAAGSPALGPLNKTEFSCDVVSVKETKGYEIVSEYKPLTQVTITSRHWGDESDSKCFYVPTKTPDGKDGTMGFGCFALKLPEVVVKVYNSSRLYIEESPYNWELDLNLVNGQGRISYDYIFNDWGFKSSRFAGDAVLKNCKVVR
ncbi:MAG: hypothetical protein NTY45_08130 [Elusimicrobia bacterium]|nr:hypothetical protein [Elusimicrobiota bacterium]